MSHCFDVLTRVFEDHFNPVPSTERGEEMLKMLFMGVLQAMHEANHQLKDAVNRDPRVTTAVRELEDFLNERGKYA